MTEKDTLNELATRIQTALDLDSVSVDVAIGELGFDSFRVVELILICDQLYETSINPEMIDLNQYTTLRDLDQQFRAMAAANSGQASVAAAS